MTLACLQVSSASAQRLCVITTEVLCNNNRRKDLLTELFFSDVILSLFVFQNLLSNLIARLTPRATKIHVECYFKYRSGW